MDSTKRVRMIDLVDDYMGRHGNWSAGTKRAYRSLFNQFAAKWDATRRAPKNMDANWVEDFFTGPGGILHTSAPASYNIRRTQLQKFIEWGIRRGHLKAGVWPDVERVREDPRDWLRLTVPEMDRAADRADPYDRWVWQLLRFTVLRESEALRGTVANITIRGNGELSTFRVLRTKAQRAVAQLHFDDLPMVGELVDEWHRWEPEYARLIGGPVLLSSPLIPRWVGRAPSRARPYETKVLKADKAPSTVRPIIKKHLRLLFPTMSAGQLDWQGSHAMRRSGALEMRKALKASGHPDPVSIVQHMMDHKTREQTLAYLGITSEREERDEAVQELGRLHPRPGLHVVTGDGREEVG
jgi:integrase